jgi:hypothetical protein
MHSCYNSRSYLPCPVASPAPAPLPRSCRAEARAEQDCGPGRPARHSPVPGWLLHVPHRHPHAHRAAHCPARAAGGCGRRAGAVVVAGGWCQWGWRWVAARVRAGGGRTESWHTGAHSRLAAPHLLPLPRAAPHPAAPQRLQRENHIGLIDTKCSPAGVCQDAIDDARSICMREKGSAPDVSVYGDPSFTFPYVPSHLHHMVRAGVGGGPGARAAAAARERVATSLWLQQRAQLRKRSGWARAQWLHLCPFSALCRCLSL